MKIVKNRRAVAAISPEKFFALISDMRNFGRLLPADMRDKYRSDENSCVITVDQIGSLNLKVAAKKPFSEVLYEGSAISRINIGLKVIIEKSDPGNSNVSISFTADTDPVTGMFLSAVLDRFLDKMVTEIENYRYEDLIAPKENPLP
mgnify:FL=1